MADFVFPTHTVLEQINQILLPRFMEGRVGLQLFPSRNVESHILEWEQKDDYIGLQQVRGLNGDPTRVKPIGQKRFLMQPGVYGEYGFIDEQELTTRRVMGQFNGNIDITDLVRDRQDNLLQRRLDRMELIIWTLLVTGTFSVADGTSILHTDAYTFQTFTAGVAWGTVATATPLADFRATALKSRGFSVNFGSRATVYMNRTTFNQLLSNTNVNDLGGRKAQFGASINGPADVNRVFAGDDLPSIEIYDEGYKDSTGTFQLFIPNNKAVLVGARRNGEVLGNYLMTRNANNPGMAPGAYMRVFDRGEERVPRSIEVHDGHNGGPAIYYPSAVVVMTV